MSRGDENDAVKGKSARKRERKERESKVEEARRAKDSYEGGQKRDG